VPKTGRIADRYTSLSDALAGMTGDESLLIRRTARKFSLPSFEDIELSLTTLATVPPVRLGGVIAPPVAAAAVAAGDCDTAIEIF